jgi:hypothetical protein
LLVSVHLEDTEKAHSAHNGAQFEGKQSVRRFVPSKSMHLTELFIMKWFMNTRELAKSSAGLIGFA